MKHHINGRKASSKSFPAKTFLLLPYQGLANMLSFSKSKAGFHTVGDDDYEEELKLGGVSRSRSSNVAIKIGPCSVLLLTILFLSSIVSTWILIFNARLPSQHDPVAPNGPSWVCQRPTTRREWRTLSEPEQLDYVMAVKCLATRPSKLRNNGTLYDDFPWVHKHSSSNGAFILSFPSFLTIMND